MIGIVLQKVSDRFCIDSHEFIHDWSSMGGSARNLACSVGGNASRSRGEFDS